MRALVIGASGQVGAALYLRLTARGHTVLGTHGSSAQPSTRRLDIRDAAATAYVIADAAADWVFFPAGLAHVDYCEDHPEEAFAINRDAPAAAARAAGRRGAGFVYFSSDYVFDGARGPYGEDDPVNPRSVYGESKLAGERAVLAESARALVIRTSVVYGPEPQGKNSVYQLLRRARAKEPMKVPTDQRASPTYNADLAAATVELVEHGAPGVFHVAGSVVLDRHAFALTAFEVFDLDPTCLIPVTTAELGQRAPRPLNGGLKIERSRSLLKSVLRGPKEGLTAMRAALGDRVR